MVLQAHEAMDALKDNLREEHVIVYDYLTSFHQASYSMQGSIMLVVTMMSGAGIRSACPTTLCIQLTDHACMTFALLPL